MTGSNYFSYWLFSLALSCLIFLYILKTLNLFKFLSDYLPWKIVLLHLFLCLLLEIPLLESWLYRLRSWLPLFFEWQQLTTLNLIYYVLWCCYNVVFSFLLTYLIRLLLWSLRSYWLLCIIFSLQVPSG